MSQRCLRWVVLGAACSGCLAGDRIKGLMKIFQIEDLPIESKMLTDALTEAQRKVEAYFFGEILLQPHIACSFQALL